MWWEHESMFMVGLKITFSTARVTLIKFRDETTSVSQLVSYWQGNEMNWIGSNKKDYRSLLLSSLLFCEIKKERFDCFWHQPTSCLSCHTTLCCLRLFVYLLHLFWWLSSKTFWLLLILMEIYSTFQIFVTLKPRFDLTLSG